MFTSLLLLACGAELTEGADTVMQLPQEGLQAPQTEAQPLPQEPTAPAPSPPASPPVAQLPTPQPAPAPQTPAPQPPAPPLPAPSLPVPTGPSWYVSTKGSDSARGTLQAPLRTIGKAVALARPGDVIRVLPGVYPEELILESRGAGVAAITLRGEGPGPTTIVPKERRASAVIRVRGRWNLDNLRVDVGGAPMVAVLFSTGSNLSFLSGSELRSGTAGAGVLVEGGQNITIQHNHIHHFIKPDDDSHGVLVVGPARNVSIRKNDIHHNSGDSVQCQAGAGPAHNVLIESNTLHDEGENGVDIKQCYGVTVRHNEIFRFPNSAIRPVGTSAGEAVVVHLSAKDVVIQNNTLSRAGRGISLLGTTTAPENVRIENNLIQDIRNTPAGNGQGIRVAGARNVLVRGNSIQNTASYALMLAGDGMLVTGLVVENNILRGGWQPFLLRLGGEHFRPGLVMDGNFYATGGIVRSDGVHQKLTGSNARHWKLFPGEQLTLDSPEHFELWRELMQVDANGGLLQ